ncbi:MAG: HAD-IIIA family hydrolase [Chloroflexi bacterium]|nr:HAD-IIIA family hydrolase [Chloroflexota bacterium]
MSGSDGLRPAIFLDRDGVIIENRSGYVRSWADVSFIPGALNALAGAAVSPFAVVIVTNQAGVGRGLISLASAESINKGVRDEILRAGGRVDGLYLCPHTDEDNCECRKPRPGMLLRAARELGLDLSRSWMIGDAVTDVQAGEAAGARSLLVLTGRGAEHRALHNLEGFADLSEALAYIRQNSNAGSG